MNINNSNNSTRRGGRFAQLYNNVTNRRRNDDRNLHNNSTTTPSRPAVATGQMPPPTVPRHRHHPRPPQDVAVELPQPDQPQGWLPRGVPLVEGRQYPITQYLPHLQGQLLLMAHRLNLQDLHQDVLSELESFTNEHLPIYMCSLGTQRCIIDRVKRRQYEREARRQRSNAGLIRQFGDLRRLGAAESANHFRLIERRLGSETGPTTGREEQVPYEERIGGIDNGQLEDGEVEEEEESIASATEHVRALQYDGADTDTAQEDGSTNPPPFVDLTTNPFNLPTYSIPLLKEIDDQFPEEINTHSDHMVALCQIRHAESFLRKACTHDDGRVLLVNETGGKCHGLIDLMKAVERTYSHQNRGQFQFTQHLWTLTREASGALKTRHNASHDSSFRRIQNMSNQITLNNRWVLRFVQEVREIPDLRRFPITEADFIAKEDRQLEIEAALSEQIIEKNSQLVAANKEIESLKERLRLAANHRDFYNAQHTFAQNEIGSNKENIDSLKAQLESANMELATNNIKTSVANDQVNCLGQKLVATTKELDATKVKLIEYQAQRAGDEARTKSAETMLASTKVELDSTKVELDSTKSKLIESQIQQSVAEERTKSIEKILSSTKTELVAMTDKYISSSTKLSMANARNKTIEKELNTTRQNYQSSYRELSFVYSQISAESSKAIKSSFSQSANGIPIPTNSKRVRHEEANHSNRSTNHELSRSLDMDDSRNDTSSKRSRIGTTNSNTSHN
mmetsp:Transcript_55828/g.135245  ORF Transcript_55828/g.135245 Transcript_55828/m.135245 type:complete len:740 (-) Transcript_55828:1815-4034(-)|eukprot:CAMPEP_0113471714 /NCGR_PEP_ID=MMETSP0014_2-20120614/17124_1 /TAXON_ID=2857 /ORGANISM="Nitzschia sp." /LENGTH=739 /DNA_ID=CAMNT_0000364365 /DNA_START=600 /DNA_END=2819 /DNA_ORIENTATION=- /assembly_acc=CAM_ASM_000159